MSERPEAAARGTSTYPKRSGYSGVKGPQVSLVSDREKPCTGPKPSWSTPSAGLLMAVFGAWGASCHACMPATMAGPTAMSSDPRLHKHMHDKPDRYAPLHWPATQALHRGSCMNVAAGRGCHAPRHAASWQGLGCFGTFAYFLPFRQFPPLKHTSRKMTTASRITANATTIFILQFAHHNPRLSVREPA